MISQIEIQNTLPGLSHALASHFVQLANLNVAEKGSFHVAFSGGKTPQLFYALLATDDYRAQIPWENIYFYQTDERFVPYSHVDNNFREMHEKLFRYLAINPQQFLKIPTEGICHSVAALQYEQILNDYLPRDDTGRAWFDFILLGVGTDGHIASLFPETRALTALTKVVDIFVPSLGSWRISLTLPALNLSKITVILAAGSSKSHVIERVLQPSRHDKIYPIEYLDSQGQVLLYLDQAAAGQFLLNGCLLP